MTGGIVVFLGPTLDHAQARRHLDAIYLPPASAGAIVAAINAHAPSAIVLIDGVFATAPAVRHKEILWALSRGCHVAGAASIGALRAAELSTLGMTGHGLIYRWYRATPFADDDEVAVAMMPVELGARPLSDALIDMRVTLRMAVRAGIMLPEFRDELLAVARSIHFLDRTYAHVFELARATLTGASRRKADALAAWVRNHAVSQKRVDAVSLLRCLTDPARCFASGPATPSFVLTEAWARDLAASGVDPRRPDL